jgi:flagellar biogenesis protein FliO
MNQYPYSWLFRVGSIWLGFGTGLFLLPGAALAQTETEIGPEFSGGQWVWSLFSLIIVVILAFWATKFLAGKFGVSQGSHIKVAESLLLGPNRHLYLLLVNGKVLLVGSTEHGINLLKEFEDEQFYNELLKAAPINEKMPTGRFAGMITPVLNNMNFGETDESGLANSKQRLQEELAKIRSWKMRGLNRDDK